LKNEAEFVSTNAPGLIENCKNCTCALAPGALVCPQCHALVHAQELQRLAGGAKLLEERGDLIQARAQWLKALELLPGESAQTEWVRDKARKLELAAPAAPPPKAPPKWVGKLGPLAPIALLLAKGKSLLVLFKLNFLLSLFAFMGVYWAFYGAKFGIGFAVLILIHEMGHFIDIKRRGLPADMPVFLPGFGAYVRWQALGVSQETRAAVSLAGPLAGWLGAAACGLLWWKTGNNLWAGLAHFTALINILNLIPVWVLDGGQAIPALAKIDRVVLLSSCLLLAIFLKEPIFVLVAGGAAYRLFDKAMPTAPSRFTTAYFVAVLTALGLVLWLVPMPVPVRS
jgi:Zn-dependent protease